MLQHGLGKLGLSQSGLQPYPLSNPWLLGGGNRHEDADCPIKKDVLPSFDALFYEPFYQFMREQFLANEMEKAHELGADVVSVLHIAPAHNDNFRKVTSTELAKLGESAISIWKKLVKSEGRVISVSIEKLFGSLSETQLPKMKYWVEYVHARYQWVREQ